MKRPLTPLLLLLALDLLFVGLHLMHAGGWLHDDRFRIDRDNGWAETFQYLKALVVALLLWRQVGGGSTLMRTWALLFVYLAADDAAMLHERGGQWLSEGLGLPHGSHVGQVLFAGLVGMAFAVALLRAWKRAPEPHQRTSLELLAAVAALGTAGVGVDFLHAVVFAGSFDLLFVLAEDGGEHLALTAALWIALTARPSGRSAGPEPAPRAGSAAVP